MIPKARNVSPMAAPVNVISVSPNLDAWLAITKMAMDAHMEAKGRLLLVYVDRLFVNGKHLHLYGHASNTVNRISRSNL